ncbi:response regulator [Pedobacter puniceum]|uniref:Sensory/regulatory protein RpfC n=1 Tax=Pedobacter puniceum TaxID=2666136 RepID=A0A7K0FLT4_9SPHI|nr:response regulator [Pedobacter puniceum]MRX46934.1 response regulator [Pedobacter puniceum]
MNKQKHIDWTFEAVNFLAGLYPIKKKKDFRVILDESTNLLKKYAHAKAVSFIRIEDEITARIEYSTSENLINNLTDVKTVVKLIKKNKIVLDVENLVQKQTSEVVVFIPLKETDFIGGVLLLVDERFKRDKAFKIFLNYALTGLKETAFIIQKYLLIEELSTRFNTILETIPQGIVFVDDVGKNGWVNSMASEILGISKEKNSPIVISEAMQKLKNTAINKDEINKEGLLLFSSPGQKKDDWKWIFGDPITSVLSVSCVPAISENIKGRMWVFTDFTFQYLAKQQLQDLSEELAEKRRIADEQNKAKSDFLSSMSHEIRTPMNGVIGMASLLENTNLSREQTDFVETIRMSGETLISIINDILDFSKIESGKVELEHKPFYINNVIEETYDLLSVNANDKGLDLLYYIEPDVPLEIIGDITRLRQIMINLVSNGIKFTEKGEIQINVRNLGVNENGLYTLEFAVKDTGIGIPEDKYHRLFESFSQVDSSTTRKYGGTGLGLAICQRLTVLMGGTMRIESEVDKGSSFIFTIKAEVNREVKQFNTHNFIDLTPLKNKRILILDDNKNNLKILKSECINWGLSAKTFENYEEALQSLATEKYDLVIIDMNMPCKDGIEVTKIIKNLYPNLPVILFSSSGPDYNYAIQHKYLFSALLNKPIKHNQMLKAVSDTFIKKAEPILPILKNIDFIKTALPINILIAEDTPINQKLLIKTLEKLGYRADLAEKGTQVLKALDQKKYHLIFMDVMMPEMDGYEVTRKILEKYSDAERPIIIAATANAMHDDQEKALLAGMDDYISKPFNFQNVKDKIEKWEKELLIKAKLIV